MDYKELFRKLERTLEQINRSADLGADLFRTVRRLVDDFRDDLGLESARIYARRGNAYVLVHEYPGEERLRGFRIPLSYAPIQELLRNGIVVHRIQDPGVDPGIEKALGVSHFAAIGVGERTDFVLAFTLGSISDPDHVVYTLSTIRHVVRLKFREERFEDRLAQTREIQLSLLPPRVPSFGDFDVYAETEPAEEVGGDLYDYITVSERVLGLALADSAGHGLPAALQARDAIIGLRMGVEENLRITATIEKLNRVVSRSALASKFISLFYGELEPDGTFVYCNAGHIPPLLMRGGAVERLSTGGLVLGPNPDARYRRGYATIESGSILLAYTDGIPETFGESGDMFETGRVEQILRSRRWPTAKALVQRVFREVRAFRGEAPAADDQTVLAVVRPSS